jgi:hypothetical protein
MFDMSPQVIVSFIGLALLMVLIPVAVHQRRLASGDSRSPSPEVAVIDSTMRGAGPNFAAAHVPSARGSLSVGQIAWGVFLGLWMFTISVGILAFGFMITVANSLGRR